MFEIGDTVEINLSDLSETDIRSITHWFDGEWALTATHTVIRLGGYVQTEVYSKDRDRIYTASWSPEEIKIVNLDEIKKELVGIREEIDA